MIKINERVREEDVKLDTKLWRLLTDGEGFPIAAIYYNGKQFSLCQESMEAIQKLILEWLVLSPSCSLEAIHQAEYNLALAIQEQENPAHKRTHRTLNVQDMEQGVWDACKTYGDKLIEIAHSPEDLDTGLNGKLSKAWAGRFWRRKVAGLTPLGEEDDGPTVDNNTTITNNEK